MKKVAFLFLVLDNPNFPDLWDSYFRGNSKKFSLYIHPKYPEKVVWKKKHIIPNLFETAWGFITRAYLSLLETAFQDKDNYKFVTISESCVPIQDFNSFYDAATEDPRSWVKFLPITKYNREARIGKHNRPNKPKKIFKHYARFCLNREHVEGLLRKAKELEYFHTMHVGDEFFLSVLYPLKNVRNFAVTFDDWDYVNSEKMKIKQEIKKQYELIESNSLKPNETDKARLKIHNLRKKFNNIAKNPKLIVNVKPDLKQIENCSSYFYRKFAKDSNIPEYWKQIIESHKVLKNNKNKRKI